MLKYRVFDYACRAVHTHKRSAIRTRIHNSTDYVVVYVAYLPDSSVTLTWPSPAADDRKWPAGTCATRCWRSRRWATIWDSGTTTGSRWPSRPRTPLGSSWVFVATPSPTTKRRHIAIRGGYEACPPPNGTVVRNAWWTVRYCGCRAARVPSGRKTRGIRDHLRTFAAAMMMDVVVVVVVVGGE